jgi:photosystem II stability/assembly factor-like uncharacterized protein
MKKTLLILFILFAAVNTKQTLCQWQLLSGPGGGSAAWIINPKPNTFITATELGMFKSTDGTASWHSLKNGPGNLFRPTGTILAGSGNNIIFSVYGHVIGAARIYFSSDCGDHWTALPGAQRMSSAVFKDNYIFYSRTVQGSGEKGIFRSSDNGSSWIHLTAFNTSGILFVKDNFLFYKLAEGLYRSSDNGDNWSLINPGSYYDAFSSYSNLMLASYNNYLYKSSDYGTTWDSVIIGFNIRKMIQHGNYLFAKDDWDFSLKRSSDIGNSWQPVNIPDPFITDLSSENSALYITNDGIRMSTDNGSTWSYRDAGLTAMSLYKIFADSINIFAFNRGSISISNDNGQIWSNIYDSLVKGGNQTFAAVNKNYFTATDSGLYKSTNNGQNWTDIKGSLQWSAAGNTVGNAFGQLYFYNPLTGLLKSTNLGVSWSALPAFPGSGISYFMEHNSNLFVYTTETNGIYRSSDQGNSWVRKDNGLTGAVITGLTVSGSELYCITSELVYKSIDEGDTWVNVQNGITGTNFRGITASQGKVCIASYQNGIYVSSDGGANWILTADGLDNDYVNGIAANSTHVFTATFAGTDYESGVYRTPSGTLLVYYSVSGNVTYADNNLPVTRGYVKALKYDRVNDKIITLDSTGILANGDYLLPRVPPDTTYIMAYDDDQEFVPTYHDSSISWQNASVIIPGSNMSNVNVKVYRVVNNFLNMHISGGVFKLQQSAFGVENAIIYAKAFGQYRGFSISNSNGAYYIDSLFPGIYSLTCDRLGYSPQYKNITLTFYSSDTTNFYLTIFTEVNKTGIEIPHEYTLEQCYPNPFNPKTTIKFGIPKASDVKLVIYDILGREVGALIDENMNPGEYKAVWDASSLASGIYFYRLTAGDFTETKRMVLLK